MSSHPQPDPVQRDIVAHVVRFCRSLREDGLLVGPAETADATRSLGMVDVLSRQQVYWAIRAVFLTTPNGPL